jgi:hypothetical protein
LCPVAQAAHEREAQEEGLRAKDSEADFARSRQMEPGKNWSQVAGGSARAPGAGHVGIRSLRFNAPGATRATSHVDRRAGFPSFLYTVDILLA